MISPESSDPAPPAWLGDYVGLPYVEGGRDGRGVDCYGLIVLVYREHFGIELPTYSPEAVSRADRLAIERAIAGAKSEWIEVPKPRLGDVVLLRVHGHAAHVGLAIDRSRMLAARGGSGVCIESFKKAQWARRIEAFYRHPQRTFA